MSDVRVGILERLFQIAVVLGRATEDVAKFPGNMTVTLASVYFTTTCDLRNLLRPKIYVKLIQLSHLFYWRNNQKNQLHLSDRNVSLIFSEDLDSSSETYRGHSWVFGRHWATLFLLVYLRLAIVICCRCLSLRSCSTWHQCFN